MHQSFASCTVAMMITELVGGTIEGCFSWVAWHLVYRYK